MATRFHLALAAAVLLAAPAARAAPAEPDVLPAGVSDRDPLFDVFLEGNDALVVGFPGTVLTSKDGGATFTDVGPGGPFALLAVDRVGGKVRACGRDGRVLWPREDGRWEAFPTGTNEHLLALDFLDVDRGMAVGNFGTAIRTADGGATWERVRVVPEGEDPTLNGVAWRDAGTVFVAGEFGVVARSDDGGRSFERVDGGLTGVALNGLALEGEGVLAVGQEGTVLWSADGREFATVEVPTHEHLVRPALSGGKGVIVGVAGTVLAADAPTGPWKVVEVPTWRWLSGVRLLPDGRGMAVGAAGVILRTTDFGRTWTRWRAP